jgi:hypothetical protein
LPVWCFTLVRNFIAGEEKPVARSRNAFLSGFKHLGADIAWIGPANGFPVFGGRIDRLKASANGRLKSRHRRSTTNSSGVFLSL